MQRRLVVGMLAWLVLVAVLHAECVILTAKVVMSAPYIDLVFAGRVVDIQDVGQVGARVTFDVQRVWKGSVPARIDLCFGRFDPERPEFTKGGYAVALARRLKDSAERKRLGLPDDSERSEYEAFGCPHEQNFEANLGTSHPPKH